jgi:peptidoglycan hydrolase-like protein with peptidoglycan-binding domain
MNTKLMHIIGGIIAFLIILNLVTAETCNDINNCDSAEVLSILESSPEKVKELKSATLTLLLQEDESKVKKFFTDNPGMLSEIGASGDMFLQEIFGVIFSQSNGQITHFSEGPPPKITTQAGASLIGSLSKGAVAIVDGIISITGLLGSEDDKQKIAIEQGDITIVEGIISGSIEKGTYKGIPITGVQDIKFRDNGEIESATIRNGQFGQFYGDFTIQYHAGFIHFAGQDNRITKISTEEYKEQMRITGSFIVKTEHMKDMKTADIVAKMGTTIFIEKDGKIDSQNIIFPKDTLISVNFDKENHDKEKEMVTFHSEGEDILTASGTGTYKIKSIPTYLTDLVTPDSSIEDIKKLQKILRQLGYYTWTNSKYPDGIDGVWGSGTEKAIKEFQESEGMKNPTGIIDKDTLLSLNEFGAITFQPGGDSHQNLARGSKGEPVKTAQRMLKELGFYTWKSTTYKDGIDGDYGPSTENAVKQFQKENGLEETGIIDEKTRKLLDEKSQAHSFSSSGTVTFGRNGNNLKIQTEGSGLIFAHNEEEPFMTFDGKKRAGKSLIGIELTTIEGIKIQTEAMLKSSYRYEETNVAVSDSVQELIKFFQISRFHGSSQVILEILSKYPEEEQKLYLKTLIAICKLENTKVCGYGQTPKKDLGYSVPAAHRRILEDYIIPCGKRNKQFMAKHPGVAPYSKEYFDAMGELYCAGGDFDVYYNDVQKKLGKEKAEEYTNSKSGCRYWGENVHSIFVS